MARQNTRLFSCLVFLASFLQLTGLAGADTEYYRHVIFDNSLEPDAYSYSDGRATSPSALELEHGKLPVSRDQFYTPPNALRLKWRSEWGGGWEADVRAMDFRNREINFRGEVLYFWCYSGDGIAATDLPFIRLEDTGRSFSSPQPLGKFVDGIPEKKWIQIRIPLREFTSGSIHQFEANRTAKVIFGQGTADSTEHTLLIDEIKIDDSTAAAAGDVQSNLAAPPNVSVFGRSQRRHENNDRRRASYHAARSLLSLLLGRSASHCRHDARKHSRRRPHCRYRRKRLRNYGSNRRSRSRLHHSPSRPRPTHKDCQFSGKSPSLSWRLVALHGRRYQRDTARF